MTFTRNSTDKTITLSGTPQEAGNYEFIIKSSGDVSGASITDTLRVHVESATGISDVNYDATSQDSEVYDLEGRRVEKMQEGRVYIVHQGRERRKIIAPQQ